MKTRNGDVPIRKIPLVKAGEAIRARHTNAMARAINELNQRRPITKDAKQQKTQLAFQPFLRVAEESESEYEISFYDGYVIERIVPVQTTDQIKAHFPTGIYDEDLQQSVWHQIQSGECAYVKLQVSITGQITGKPEIFIGAEDAAQTHYYPEVGDYAGAVGEHLYKICKFEIDEFNQPVVTLYQVGDDGDHYAERVTMKNLESGSGSVRKILKDYEPDTDIVNFRTLSQLAGSGEELIKDGDTDSIEFRRIKERDTSPQVTVNDDGDAISIEGNGVDGDNAAVTVVDGLVTVVKEIAAGGLWATITWTFMDEVGSDGNQLEATFQAGLLTGLTATTGFITGAGTEADPFIAQFNSKDTDT